MAKRYATSDEIIAVYPAVEGMDATLVSMMTEVAQASIELALWGVKASIGHALLTAHYLAVLHGGTGEGAETGTPIKLVFAEMEVDYAQSSAVQSEMGTTRFGRAFETLRATLCAFPVAGRY